VPTRRGATASWSRRCHRQGNPIEALDALAPMPRAPQAAGEGPADARGDQEQRRILPSPLPVGVALLISLLGLLVLITMIFRQ
jgi:hypothetical protein